MRRVTISTGISIDTGWSPRSVNWAVITGPAYQALQELNSLQLENLPRPVEGGSYGFVLKVCAVGPYEFAHYAAQLGLDVQQYSDPSAPLGILLNHNSLRQGGKLYDFDLFNLKPGDRLTASKMAEWSSPQTGGAAPASLTWTVGAVAQENPLGFLGAGLVPEMIVSDAVFDGLSDRMLQLGPIANGNMTVKSNNPDAALAVIQRLYQATVGGNFSYNSMAEFNKSSNLQTLMTNLFFYGFLTLITLIGVTNIVNTLDTNIKLRRREIAMLKSVGLTPAGVKDQAFNQLAWEGIQKASQEMGLQVKFIEFGRPGDYEKNIDALASEGYTVILTVGASMGDATASKAKQYPKIKFAIVDNAYAISGLANVTSLMFAEDQAAVPGRRPGGRHVQVGLCLLCLQYTEPAK